MANPNNSTTTCCECGASIPVNPGYTTWCDKCGWNLNPYGEESNKDLSFRIYRYLGKKFSKKLLDSLLKKDLKEKYSTPARPLAYALVGFIYLTNLILFLTLVIAGIFLFLRGTVFIKDIVEAVFVILGLLCLIMAYVIIPKYKKYENYPVKRDEYPNLYKLLDKIADNMGTKHIDRICIDESFNASYYQTFIKGERIITIGLPLFYILSNDERVALLSHEVAHGANSDITRGRFVGGAYRLLINWQKILGPSNKIAEVGFIAIFYPVLMIMFPLRWLLWKYVEGIWFLLAALIWRDNQRAEYLADFLASKAAGTEAMITLHKKIHFGDSFWSIMSDLTRYGYSKDLIADFKNRLSSIPERELQRVERLDTELLSSIDASHPPTVYRIRLMREYFNNKTVKLDDMEMKEIEEELKTLRSEINFKLSSICRSYQG